MQKSQLSEKGPYNAINTELMTEGSCGSGFPVWIQGFNLCLVVAIMFVFNMPVGK